MNNNESQSNGNKTDNDAAKEERYTYESESQENDTNDEQSTNGDSDGRSEAEEQEQLEPSAESVAATSAVNTTPSPIAAAEPANKRGAAGWIALSAVLVVVLIVVLIKPPFGGGSSAGNDTVAVVNGDNITKDELYEVLVKVNGEAALENLIMEKLVRQQADASSISITEQDITDEIDAIKLQYGSDEAFDMVLMQYGITMEALREDMRLSAMVRKVLEPQTNITDEDVQTFFDENKSMMTATPEQVRASHILVETREEAEAILADLEAGADFAATAEEKSMDPGSAAVGGDLDFFVRERMVPEFSEAAFALEIGEISEIVQSTHGFHIILKTDYRAGEEVSFEDKKQAIRTLLVGNETRNLSNEWMDKIRGEATITNTLTDDAEADEASSNTAE